VEALHERASVLDCGDKRSAVTALASEPDRHAQSIAHALLDPKRRLPLHPCRRSPKPGGSPRQRRRDSWTQCALKKRGPSPETSTLYFSGLSTIFLNSGTAFCARTAGPVNFTKTLLSFPSMIAPSSPKFGVVFAGPPGVPPLNDP